MQIISHVLQYILGFKFLPVFIFIFQSMYPVCWYLNNILYVFLLIENKMIFRHYTGNFTDIEKINIVFDIKPVKVFLVPLHAKFKIFK